MNTSKYFAPVIFLFILLVFSECTKYYLENIQLNLLIPNSAPIATIDRNKDDIRLSCDITGNISNRLTFDDGNHVPLNFSCEDTNGNLIYLARGNDAKIAFPIFQGSVNFDYTVFNNILFENNVFIYSGVSLGYYENMVQNAFHAGCGVSVKGQTSVIQCYLYLNAHSLQSNGQVYAYTPKLFLNDETADIYNVKYNNYGYGTGAGFQFSTLKEYLFLSNLTYGIDFQWFQYFGFGNPVKYSSRLILASPSIGMFKTLRNNQFNFTLKCGILFPQGPNTRQIADGFIPSAELIWTHCFNKLQADPCAK